MSVAKPELSRRLCVAAACSVLLSVGVVHAEPKHGLSQFGELKYPPGFLHFDYVNPDAPKGGTIRIPSSRAFYNLNPFIRQGRAPSTLKEIVYQTLLTRAWDEPSALYGLLAESVELAEDGSWIEYRLRPEARWHDGLPVTSRDVVFTVEILKAQGSPREKMMLMEVESAEERGPRSVRIHFGPGAHRQLPLHVSGEMEILPAHYWADQSFDETTLEPPLGSGPYRVVEVELGRRITYERAPDWWGQELNVNVGRFNFDRIQFKFYQDLHMTIEAIKGREVDSKFEMISHLWRVAYEIPAKRRGLLLQETLRTENPMRQNLVILNLRRQKFEDARVREAFFLAYDQPLYRQKSGANVEVTSRSYFEGSDLEHRGPPSEHELALLEPFRQELDPRIFERQWDPPPSPKGGRNRPNLLKADRLLREAGWVVRDGVRVNAQTGEPFQLKILTATSGEVPGLLMYADNLKRLGITAKLRTVQTAEYVNTVLVERDFDLTVSLFILKVAPGAELRNLFGSHAGKRPYGLNLPGIQSRAADFLIERIVGAKSRQELVTAAHALDRVLLYGFYYISMGATPGMNYAFWNIFGRPQVPPRFATGYPYTWWIDQDKLAKVESGASIPIERAGLD